MSMSDATAAKFLRDEAHCYEKISSKNTVWNPKGGWLKKPGEPNVFDITLHDIVAAENPLRVTNIFGKEPDLQYPVGCSVMFLRDLLRRFGIPYKSLSKAQCLQRLAAKKLKLPMPEFEETPTTESEVGAVVTTGELNQKRAAAENNNVHASPKRSKKGAAKNVPAEPSIDSLLDALTAVANVTPQQNSDSIRLIRSLTAFYDDKRVIDLQDHYWTCLERVQAACAKHHVNWDTWRQVSVFTASAYHPDCLEARRHLEETHDRLEQARAFQRTSAAANARQAEHATRTAKV